MSKVRVIHDGIYRCSTCIRLNPHDVMLWNVAVLNCDLGDLGELHYCKAHADDGLDRLLKDVAPLVAS